VRCRDPPVLEELSSLIVGWTSKHLSFEPHVEVDHASIEILRASIPSGPHITGDIISHLVTQA
jgi:hypothetical protein